MTRLLATLQEAFGPARLREHVPLAPFTTFRVGGPADVLFEARGSVEIVRALELAHQHGVPVTMLGGGSNVLVSDRGIRGLVVRPRGGVVQTVDTHHVRADAAMTINGLVRWTILRGLGGLERWAGTPGTVGGAVVGNAHFGGRLIGEVITEVQVVDRTGRVTAIRVAEMGFAYDRSRVQHTGEVVLTATFHVSAADPTTLRETARASLAYRKRTQPLETPSAGCVFQNPETSRDRLPAGMPSSAGALVDHAALKGLRIGGARVSEAHGNFIVNEGAATAVDIRALIERCKSEVQRQFGVTLREEIVYLGDFGVHTAH